MKHVKFLLISLVSSAILLLLLFKVPFEKPAPIGAPSDYYQIVHKINEKNVDIILVSNEKFFKTDLIHYNVDSITDISNSTKSSVIVIDFDKIDYFSEDDGEHLKDLYLSSCNKIVLLNYKYESHKHLNTLIDIDDLESEMMVLDFTTCDGIHFSKAVIIDELNDNSYVYAVMRTILGSL